MAASTNASLRTATTSLQALRLDVTARDDSRSVAIAEMSPGAAAAMRQIMSMDDEMVGSAKFLANFDAAVARTTPSECAELVAFGKQFWTVDAGPIYLARLVAHCEQKNSATIMPSWVVPAAIAGLAVFVLTR